MFALHNDFVKLLTSTDTRLHGMLDVSEGISRARHIWLTESCIGQRPERTVKTHLGMPRTLRNAPDWFQDCATTF